MGTMVRKGGRVGLWVVLLMLVAVAVLPVTASPVPNSDGATDTDTVGLDERLGAKIPLDVEFRDETGATVRLGELITGPTIILPVYYSCPNVCYRLQWELATVLPQLRLAPGQDYRVISFSFDQEETPAQAAQYRRIYLAKIKTPFPPEAWRFLTGDGVNIQRLTTAIGYRFYRQRRDFVHPVASLVVARDGTIVRYLHGTSFRAKDLALALAEAREGKVGSAVRGLMAYCFTFDPVQRTYVFNLLRVSATVVILTAGGFLAFLILTGRGRHRQRKVNK